MKIVEYMLLIYEKNPILATLRVLLQYKYSFYVSSITTLTKTYLNLL